MPFTLSHPVAALVLRGTRLPMGALVAGTMAPDLPMFLPSHFGYSFTHSLAGVVTADLVISVLGLAAWMFLVRDALVDTAPSIIRQRLPAAARYSSRQWALVPLAAIIGALTHVGWDELTHVDRWGARHIAWLRTDHYGWAGYHWAQAVSTVVGLAVVLLWSAVHLLRMPQGLRPAQVGELAGRASGAVVTVAGVAAGIAGLSRLGGGLHAAAFAAAVVGTLALAGALLVTSVAWQLLAHRQ